MPPLNLRAQIERDEGLRLKPYRDSVGKLTIGYGRNLDDRGITKDEAALLLAHDLADAWNAVESAFPWARDLSEPRMGVLVNMAFMGIGRLKGFVKMLAAMEAGDWEAAARELLDSKYAGQVGARADRLAQQLREDRMI